MATSTAVISIGRNVGHLPMSSAKWHDFKRSIRESTGVLSLDAIPVFEGSGHGVYDGMQEESYTVILANVRDKDVHALRRRLSILAGMFGQESIALTIGRTEFIAPERRGAEE